MSQLFFMFFLLLSNIAAILRSFSISHAPAKSNIGCTVILDWGFWSLENRRSLTEFCRSQNVHCEWHYIDVNDRTWNKNIEERNHRVLNGEGGSDYYLDEGLMGKLLSMWEAPSKAEIDVWYTLERK